LAKYEMIMYLQVSYTTLIQYKPTYYTEKYTAKETSPYGSKVVEIKVDVQRISNIIVNRPFSSR